MMQTHDISYQEVCLLDYTFIRVCSAFFISRLSRYYIAIRSGYITQVIWYTCVPIPNIRIFAVSFFNIYLGKNIARYTYRDQISRLDEKVFFGLSTNFKDQILI